MGVFEKKGPGVGCWVGVCGVGTDMRTGRREKREREEVLFPFKSFSGDRRGGTEQRSLPGTPVFDVLCVAAGVRGHLHHYAPHLSQIVAPDIFASALVSGAQSSDWRRRGGHPSPLIGATTRLDSWTMGVLPQ